MSTALPLTCAGARIKNALSPIIAMAWLPLGSQHQLVALADDIIKAMPTAKATRITRPKAFGTTAMRSTGFAGVVQAAMANAREAPPAAVAAAVAATALEEGGAEVT